jgi:GR25 family glycosyltransferase involved in LPS biosynthesis
MLNKTNIDKYFNLIDIIYWINLDRSSTRRQYMENMLKNINVKNERISAIDGKNLSIDDFNKFLVFKNQNYTNYEYACLVSHLKTILTFSQSNYNYALIFEDDVSLDFSEYWNKSISDIISNAPKDWGILMMGHNTHYNLTENYTEFNKNLHLWGAFSYIINKKAAVDFINSIYKNNKFYLIDNYNHLSDHYIFQAIKTYIYKYPYFTILTDSSTIHNENIKGHKETQIKAKNKWLLEKLTNNNSYSTCKINIILIICIILIILIFTFINIRIKCFYFS